MLNTDKNDSGYFIGFAMYNLKLPELASAVGNSNVLLLTLDGRRLK